MAGIERVEKWKAGWESGVIDFHMPKEHPTLLNYYGKITGGEKSLRFFVPLCGKTWDMKWLADHGQEVVGVEGIEIACHQFYEEQKVKYSTSEIPGIPDGKLFTSEDGKIKIYQCDALALTSDLTGKFDVVWDRGALVAIDPPVRSTYVKVLQDLTKPGSRLLFELFEYDFSQRIRKRAPYPMFRKDVDKEFGEWCLISEENRANMIDQSPKFREWGLDWMTNITYLIQPK